MYDGSQNDAQLNREILCRELRENPPAWWDFQYCTTCAIELALQLGLMPEFNHTRPTLSLGRAFGLDYNQVMRAFYEGRVDKTPVEVALQLETAPFKHAFFP